MGKRIKAEYVFLIYALIFGLLLVFLIPPLNVPDEGAHYLNAYAVSKGKLWGEIVDGQVVRKVPKDISDFEIRYSNAYAWVYDAKMDYSDIINEIRSTNELGETVIRGGAIVCPTGYLVSGGGMVLGRFLGKLFSDYFKASQPYNQLIFGRLANLLFYVFITFLVLKIIPCFKRSLMLIAMMPMTLFLGASLNYDAVLLPITFLFVAIIARLVYRKEEKIQLKEIAIVLFCVFFLVGVKQSYAPLLLMLLAVPRKKYGGVRNMTLCITAVVVVSVIAYIPQLIHQQIGSQAAMTASGEAVAEQGRWISENLLKLPGIFLNTLRVKKNGYIESFWGILGVLDTPFPKVLVVTGLLMILMVAITEVCNFSLFWREEWWKRLLPVAAVTVIICGMMYIMYREWTPLPVVTGVIGGDVVEGIQGRYFIPVFLPLCLALSNRLLSFAAKKIGISEETKAMLSKRIDYVTYSWSFLCGLFTVLFILLRYWI